VAISVSRNEMSNKKFFFIYVSTQEYENITQLSGATARKKNAGGHI